MLMAVTQQPAVAFLPTHAPLRSAVETVTEALATIAVTEPHVHALLHVDPAGALATARGLDRRRALGRPDGPLTGTPLVVKDNILVRGMPTSCGSAALPVTRATRDATLVHRLRHAGAVVLGKSNLDEFAMGATTETSAEGPTRHPRDLGRSPGGSSGGSAAAVASGEVGMAVGTDTGGSIREPAALCGIVGVKPSYGSVPAGGVMPFAPSLDQAGPLAATVHAAARLHDVMAAATGLGAAAELGRANPDLTGHRIGLVRQMCGPSNSGGVRHRLDAVVTVLSALGAEVVEVSVPSTSEALSAYYSVSSYECVPALEPYAAALGPEALRRYRMGRRLRDDPDGAGIGWGIGVAQALRSEVAAAFARCTVLASPTMPVTAPPLGLGLDDPMSAPRTDCWTVLANLTGIAAMSLPAGDCPDTGLPVGVQLMAPAGLDSRLYRVAAAVETVC
jgi:aspartyl-tRNA(Asn)/glutamyl-tRNA(Gln) amidotransferase subunit A